MVSADSKFGQIHVADSGSGDPVVMIHCSAASGDEWQSLSASLGQKFRSIAPDQWGCGASDPWPGHSPFSLSQEARPILELLKEIDRPSSSSGTFLWRRCCIAGSLRATREFQESDAHRTQQFPSVVGRQQNGPAAVRGDQ